MTMVYWPFKDTDEVIDYSLDWSKRIDIGDTIVDSDFVIDNPEVAAGTLTINAYPQTFGPMVTTVWLSAGITGESYTLTNTINTQGGRVLQQSVTIKIQDR